MKKYKIKKPSINFLREDESVYGARIEDELPNRKPTFRLIDLFCGAGGMTLGFTGAFGHHFKPIWANDFNKYAVETYNANFGNHCTLGDIVEILSNPKTIIPEADVVIGGPPCQGFSLLNRNRNDDPRRELWRPYLEVVEKCKAKVFVIENVPQLLDTFEHGKITGMAEELGFRVVSGKIFSAD
jgi:DNA (cytosine-5)-methyltransferase 1